MAKTAAFGGRDVWLPPAGSSFGCARGLAALRMTSQGEVVCAHTTSHIPHPASRRRRFRHPASVIREAGALGHKTGSELSIMDAFWPRLPKLLLLSCVLLASAGPLRAASNAPVSIQDLCLMLRSGYTGDEVLGETATRPLFEPVDACAEKTLLQAGADASFIARLKASHPILTKQEADAAHQRQYEIDRRDFEARKASQARLLEAQPPTPGGMSQVLGRAISPHMADLLHGKLVTMRDGQLSPYDEQALGRKKLFALYFSASWCGPCRRFTPQLVEFYQQAARAHPELEIVFISADRTPAAMANYMRQDGMAWPALSFERKEQEAELTHYAGSGIPDLVLLDSSGQVLSDSYQGKTYVGPQKVLADLNRLLAAGTPSM